MPTRTSRKPDEKSPADRQAGEQGPDQGGEPEHQPSSKAMTERDQQHCADRQRDQAVARAGGPCAAIAL